MDTANLAFGFAAGILASTLSWFAVALYFTPRLRISTLNRLPQPIQVVPSGYRYRVKLQNVSRRYHVADLSLHARVVVCGLDPQRPHVQTSLRMPVGEVEPYPVLDARRHDIPPEDYERVYTLRVHEVQGAAVRRLPEDVRAGLEDRSLRLEHLLELGTDSFIRFAVSSSHARSGLRRTYSRKFRLADLAEGEFEQPGVTVRPA